MSIAIIKRATLLSNTILLAQHKHQPVELITLIKTIQDILKQSSIKNFHPMQPGDVVANYLDVVGLNGDIGLESKTTLVDGIAKWVE